MYAHWRGGVISLPAGVWRLIALLGVLQLQHFLKAQCGVRVVLLCGIIQIPNSALKAPMSAFGAVRCFGILVFGAGLGPCIRNSVWLKLAQHRVFEIRWNVT